MNDVGPVLTSDTQVNQVLEEALRAWEVSGAQVEVQPIRVHPELTVVSLRVTDLRQVEFIVEEDVPSVWGLLRRAASASWHARALVPLSLVGVAHQELRRNDCSLQGWWIDNNRAAFGGIEIA